MPPLISILIPVRNAVETLDEALQSLVDQTFGDWEGLLVNDCSNDATLESIGAWIHRDPRFRVITLGKHSGIVPALNQGFAEARGSICARMDADDVAEPMRFELQLERLRQADVEVVGCRTRYFPDEQVQDGARRYEAWLNSLTTPREHERDLYIECPLAHPTFMLRTETLRRLGGYQDNGWPEDYDLLMRLSLAGGRMAKIPEVLLNWRESSTRSSRTQPQYSLERFPKLRAHYLLQRELQDRSALIFGAGRVGKAQAKELLNRGAKVEAFVDLDPRKVGRRPNGIPVLSLSQALGLRGRPYGLAALAQPGQREALREVLYAGGWREPEDFRCVA